MFSGACLFEKHQDCKGTRLAAHYSGYEGSTSTIIREECTCKCHEELQETTATKSNNPS